MSRAAAFAATSLLVAATAWPVAQESPRPLRPTYASKGEIEVLPVQGSVYMLAGAGSNVTLQVGADAVMLVDTNEAAMSDKLLAAIRTITKLPIRYIVNTSADADHVGGNERLAKSAGTTLNAFLNQGARVYAHEQAYARLANPKSGDPLPVSLWPTDAFGGAKKTMFVTGEPVEIVHQPAAHTDGDVMVFFRKSDVISAGDLFVTTSYPVIDAARGGSLQGELDALNRIIDIAVPEFNAMGGTRIVPGHGRISNEIDVVEYRDMLTIVRDRVALLVDQGKTLEQVKAAGVTLEYDGIHGTTSGPWTTAMFIEAVYRELSSAAARGRSTRNAPGSTALTGKPVTAPARTAAASKASSDPFAGTWALDTVRSEYVPSTTMPYRREMTLAFEGDQLTHQTSTWRRTNGNDSPLLRVSYSAKLDGKEYPVIASSSKVTFRRVDPRTVERTAVGDRNARETATWTLSADAKLLTIVTKGVDAAGTSYSSTQVYERVN